MIVGLTYDLRSEWISQGFSEVETAEMDREDTVVAIETALHAEGFQTERIGNFKSLIAALLAGQAVGPRVQLLRGNVWAGS